MSAKASLLFSITDKLGGLQEVLEIIKKHNLNLSRIESRPSRDELWDYDFFVDFENAAENDFNSLIKDLKGKGTQIQQIFHNTIPNYSNINSSIGAKTNINDITPQPHHIRNIPWFPRKISDLDEFARKVMEYGEELSADHPGFTDQAYRERRKEIVEIAKLYKHGDKIPKIEYTPEEIRTWRIVYTELKKLFPTHACRQMNYMLPLLEQNCGYGPNNIPQLEDISKFLSECTGWRVRPVQGLLTQRDFLNALAFRVFHSTQYMRHPSKPLYTPEPDVCHELIGHIPLFADPDFADFSQEIGLASLGASDEDIKKLGTCYWFTVEFGLCREGSDLKAYGAGLLSSFGELQYCLGDNENKPQYLPFDPFETCNRDYPITEYQPIYYVADSFQSAKEKLLHFTRTMNKPFNIRYNPYTQSIEILDSNLKLIRVIKEVQSELSVLQAALSDINKA